MIVIMGGKGQTATSKKDKVVSLVLLGFSRTRCGIALFGFWTAEFDLKAVEGFPAPSKDLEPALK